MKYPFYSFWLLFLSALSLHAQPGGGGGLRITQIYDAKLQAIDMLADSSLKIRSFILRNGKLLREANLFDTYRKNSKIHICRNVEGFGLPPLSDYLSYNGEKNSQTEIWRLSIVYQKDTMLIDFIDLMEPNASGYSDHIDSIVVQSGYFRYDCKCKRNSYKDIDAYYESCYEKDSFLFDGLTLANKARLMELGFLEYQPQIDKDFLNEEYYLADYYFARAWGDLSEKNTAAAFENIRKGIQKNKGIKDCEANFLLCEAYTQNEEYAKAAKALSKAMHCKKDKYSELEENYEMRAALYIQLQQYGKALQDYNRWHKAAAHKYPVALLRAQFKMKYLKNYPSVIKDMRAIIDTIPLPVHGYEDAYFMLATAEYKQGKESLAFRHYLWAVEFGHRDYLGAILLLDTLILQHPKEAELYLARAIAQRNMSRFEHNEKSKAGHEVALADIERAERLGWQDYRLDMYKAEIFSHQKRHQEALKLINATIEKYPLVPALRFSRYQIRKNMNLVSDWRTDFDRWEGSELEKSWKWSRY